MMTNKQPWHAVVNTALLVKIPAKKSSLTVVKKEGAIEPKTIYRAATPTAKRYSFDDNGGGYLGL